jgi:Anti-sigma-D factor RsdA to sigma factor binding region
MPESGHAPFDQPDPDELARTERLLDALAKRQPVDFSDVGDGEDPRDKELAGLLEDWRDELGSPPPSTLCSELEAVVALNRGLAARRRTRRSLAVIGSVAATVLGIGGFAAVIGGAQPGDAFYGVHTMLFGEPPSVHDDRIALAAKTDLGLVQQMIMQGHWDEAQDKLAAVNAHVQNVNDTLRKQDLIDQVNMLTAKVATRDPNVTTSLSSRPNPGVASATGTTTPVTASETTSDTSVTVTSTSQSTTDPSATLSMTPPTSSAAPAAGVTTTTTAAPSGDPGSTTQQPNPNGG